jgi:pimeloyl-ACP methyl ester carboxylesterase
VTLMGNDVPVAHVILLGDSIFDNATYAVGAPDVVRQVRQRLPQGSKATLAAVDGGKIGDVRRQLRRVPSDATHLVLSVGAVTDVVLERWFTPAFRTSRLDVVEWARRMLLGTPAEGYAGCCEAVRDADLGDRLGAIRAPTVVIAGADDPAAPPDQAEFICDSIPDASLELIPDAAHHANLEQPKAVTQTILDHLSPVVMEGR